MLNFNMLCEILGIIGSFFIVSGFYFIQFNKNKMKLYNTINFIGAVFLLISLSKNPNLGSILIEIFWIIISFYGIFKK